MAANNDTIHTEGNIKTGSRILRTVVALCMLFYPMFIAQSYLESLALLPILAIYPMFTAVVGWDPVLFVQQTYKGDEASQLLVNFARGLLMLVGFVMLLVVLISPDGYLGLLSVSALLSIIPIWIAIIGENPIAALRDSFRDSIRESNSELSTIDEYLVDQASYWALDSVLDKNAVNGGKECNRTKKAA